jgi:hypothetical protein
MKKIKKIIGGKELLMMNEADEKKLIKHLDFLSKLSENFNLNDPKEHENALIIAGKKAHDVLEIIMKYFEEFDDMNDDNEGEEWKNGKEE